MGKNQFPKAGPISRGPQQVVRLVIQSRASPPSSMSSRVTILLFWYVVLLSENQTSPAPGKEERYKLNNNYIFNVLETFSLSEAESINRRIAFYRHIYLMRE